MLDSSVFILKKAARIREAFSRYETNDKKCQCLLLKSRKEPLGGVRAGFFDFVASQIIFDKPCSIGKIVIANRYMATNARANIKSIAAEMIIASRMTGITAPRKTVISSSHFEYTTMILKLKAIII